jgi:hypothetical protein
MYKMMDNTELSPGLSRMHEHFMVPGTGMLLQLFGDIDTSLFVNYEFILRPHQQLL